MSEGEYSSLEIAYKAVCGFEKLSYEDISENENNEITYKVNKGKFLELDSSHKFSNEHFKFMHFSSYQDLYNSQYKSTFERNLKVINLDLLKKEIGEKNLIELVKNDFNLRKILYENTKELDLDSDGVPDRIDIDDTNNSVQTVADLHTVGNSANKEIARSKRSEELEL